jgi:hypothetical protein
MVDCPVFLVEAFSGSHPLGAHSSDWKVKEELKKRSGGMAEPAPRRACRCGLDVHRKLTG